MSDGKALTIIGSGPVVPSLIASAGDRRVPAHESLCTTKLYDRTSDDITLDEIKRIAI